jgi:eukaryotic-like serine/threonine-protein kinase
VRYFDPGMSRASTDDDVLTATVQDRPTVATTATAELAPSTRIDRFVILDKLGQGGMGAVYAAHDTLLARNVAIKVVRPKPHNKRGSLHPREQLLREAQAMARLHHPNVVAVLDVGELGESIYLALELVEGQTLSAWLREARRPWQQVVATFVEAGRGLAAAHAAGLVHRDVKPGNILVGNDGRARITDFGVVSLHHGRRDTPDAVDDPASDIDTFSGMRVGTPAYMAPEQSAGKVVDARADQFSFCVALWEGLFGERPWAPQEPGRSLERTLRDVPRDRDVPSWLVAVIKRGLSSDPEQRWPSMAALLSELTRDRTKRRRILLGAIVATGLVVTGALALVGWTRQHEAATVPCQDEARHLAGVWDGARAEALATTLRATGAPAAEMTARRVRSHLDTWARSWVEQRTEACTATRIHGDQSDSLLEARMRCLDRRLVRVQELVGQLGMLDRDQLARAIEMTSDLPELGACADPAQLGSTAALPDDPETRERVEALEQELARVTAFEQAGRYPAALALAIPALDRAAATRHLPIHAEALAAVGRLRAQTGDHGAAIDALREAAALAASGRADDVAAKALVELVWTTADAGRGAEALAVAAAVAPAVARVHDPQLDAILAIEIGAARMAANDLVAAANDLERALALTVLALGSDHIRVAQVLNRLGSIEDQRNRPVEARAYYSRALDIVAAKLGSEHPSFAITRANICYLDAMGDQLAEAATCYADVIAKLEAALGSEHPQVAWALNDAGLVEQERGRVDEARASWERAVLIYERTSRGEHPDIAYPLVNLGGLAQNAGDAATSEALCRRALGVVEATAAGSSGRGTLEALVCLGASLAERRPAEASSVLERALKMDDVQHDPHLRGLAWFALARTAATRGDHRRAATSARDALAALTEAGPAAQNDRAALVTWMKQQAKRSGTDRPWTR